MSYVEFERRRGDSGRSGVFIAWEFLALLGVALVACAAAVLAVVVPDVAQPVGVAAAVAGLPLAVIGAVRGKGPR